jgi:broad specificity phosphatase PhoE
MKLYFVRHGETDANRILGHGVSGPMHNEPVTFTPGQNTNIPLNIYGRTHAKEACLELPNDIAAIYSSPLLRAKETAEIIADNKNIDRSHIKLRDELIEYYQGLLEGLAAEERKKAVQGKEPGSGLLCNYDYTPWGGDSWKTIYDRLNVFLAFLRESNVEGNIVCVTSSGVIRMIYKIFFEDKAPYISKYIQIKNGSVHEFIF